MFKITVRGQSLLCQSDICATDTIDYLTCDFDFSSDWAGLTKTAQFSQNGKTYSVLVDKDVCFVPTEIGEGSFEISVFGVYAGRTKRITTLPLTLNMRKSGFVPDGETPVPPTEDLYSQFVKKVDDALQSVPVKLSQFENDTNFATKDEVPKNLSEMSDDVGFAKATEIPQNISELSNDEGYVKSQNDKDVEIRTSVDGIWPAYFLLDNGSLKAKVFGYGGVDISAGEANPVKISAYGGVEISSAFKPVIIKNLATPSEGTDATNKDYVDSLVGDIETALDGIITLQNSLIGGES